MNVADLRISLQRTSIHNYSTIFLIRMNEWSNNREYSNEAIRNTFDTADWRLIGHA